MSQPGEGLENGGLENGTSAWKTTGWPRAVARPRLPQTRTCAINAFGSSSYPFACAIRRCRVDTISESDVSVMFPSNGLITRRPASLPRVQVGASSPASAVLSGRYDFLPFFPPRFVSFARAVPLKALVFRPHAAERCRGRVSRSWSPGISRRDFGQWKRQDLLRSWGTPIVLLPCSPTPAGPTNPAIAVRRRGPRYVHGEGSRNYSFRGSITRLRHWLSTLRRPGRPDTTQDSLPAVGQTLPDGLVYPQGSIERFHNVSYMDPPFPSST
jgi:hypothetical protein